MSAEPEQTQANALEALGKAAAVRQQLQQREHDATVSLRRAVQSALHAGSSSRRVADVAGISLDTLHRWKDIEEG